MALKARLGLVTGTRDAPSQLVTVFDTAGATLDYQTALDYALTQVPLSLFGALPDITQTQVDERKDSAIRFSVGYNRRGQSILLRSVNAQTRAKKIYHFLSEHDADLTGSTSSTDSTGKVYGISGADVTSDYTHEKWKVGGAQDQSALNNGQEIAVDPLPSSRTVTYRTRRANITDGYLDGVESLVARGVFNNASFWGRAAKSLQFNSFSVNEREDGDWELSYGFGYQAVRVNVDVGDGVQIPSLYGNQSYWPVQKEMYVDTKLQRKTVSAIVGDVWPVDDFTALKLPWPGSLTTRTSSVAGVVTTLYAHDITASDTVYLFWNGGYMTAAVSSVTTLGVTFSGGTGDALPLADTNLCITKYTT